MLVCWKPSPRQLKGLTIILIAQKRYKCFCSVIHWSFRSDGDVYVYLQIPESFADCLGGLLSVVGQNMELFLSCANGCSIVRAHAKNPPVMSDQNTK